MLRAFTGARLGRARLGARTAVDMAKVRVLGASNEHYHEGDKKENVLTDAEDTCWGTGAGRCHDQWLVLDLGATERVRCLELRFAEMVPGWAVKEFVLQTATEVCECEEKEYI